MRNLKIVILATSLQSFQSQFLIFREWEVLYILIKHIICMTFTIFHETIWHVDTLILLRYDDTYDGNTRQYSVSAILHFASWVKTDWFIALHYFWTTAHPPYIFPPCLRLTFHEFFIVWIFQASINCTTERISLCSIANRQT